MRLSSADWLFRVVVVFGLGGIWLLLVAAVGLVLD